MQHRCLSTFPVTCTSILLLMRIAIFRVNLDESTTYYMWPDTPMKLTLTYSRKADTTLKIAGVADKMIHKHDGHAMIFTINVLCGRI